jgi:DNA-binding phage protein
MIQPAKHDDWLFDQLQDAEFAAKDLNAANEDGDPQTQLSRETLYRTLSACGNPTIKTLAAVLKVTGLKISIVPVS